MSEYQYYHFLAIDRPLSREDMAALRVLSTRASITATSFTNEYHWGNFKGDPDELMERYFDAFVYVTNWGSRHLQLRFPERLLSADAVAPYLVGGRLEARREGEFAILTFSADDESGHWELERDPGEWLPALVLLRDDLMNGDLRALFLAWLAAVQDGYVEEDEYEPPLPAGLGALTASQEALADLLMLDRDLIRAAAQGSGPASAPAGPTRDELAAWIAKLPEEQKTALLVRVAVEGDATVGPELRLRHRVVTQVPVAIPAGGTRRTAGVLLRAAESLAEERERRAAEREAQARAKYLVDLAAREASAWREVEGVFDSPLRSNAKAAAFEAKAKLLRDLHDLAAREGQSEAFEARVAKLRAKHAKKTSFWARYDGSRR